MLLGWLCVFLRYLLHDSKLYFCQLNAHDLSNVWIINNGKTWRQLQYLRFDVIYNIYVYMTSYHKQWSIGAILWSVVNFEVEFRYSLLFVCADDDAVCRFSCRACICLFMCKWSGIICNRQLDHFVYDLHHNVLFVRWRRHRRHHTQVRPHKILCLRQRSAKF